MPEHGSEGPAEPTGPDESITLHQEELDIARRTESYGAVRVGKSVETRRVEQEIPREVEELEDIERMAPSENDSGEVETLEDGSVSVPIFEEELVVTKRLVVRERIVVRKRTTKDIERVVADLRRERASVEVDEGVEAEGVEAEDST
jgi:uncharacterized protein (TIGR02271 family)